MARIENTELELDDIDADVLDYYLGGDSETKEQWAQRVWDFCRRKDQGEDLASVYATRKNLEGQNTQTWQERAFELWDNKKQKRKESIKKDLKIKDKDLKDLKNHGEYSRRSDRIN